MSACGKCETEENWVLQKWKEFLTGDSTPRFTLLMKSSEKQKKVSNVKGDIFWLRSSFEKRSFCQVYDTDYTLILV